MTKWGNGEVIILKEKEYKKLFQWLKNTFETTTLLDLVSAEKEEEDIYVFIKLYRSMQDAVIDFETEFVVFNHDW